jgi:hypothetical protein
MPHIRLQLQRRRAPASAAQPLASAVGVIQAALQHGARHAVDDQARALSSRPRWRA